MIYATNTLILHTFSIITGDQMSLYVRTTSIMLQTMLYNKIVVKD